MKRKMPITKDRLERRLRRVERALADALDVARCAFPQDDHGNIEPINSWYTRRLNIWDKYVRCLRISEKKLL